MSELVSGLMALRLLRVSGENQGYTGTLQEDPGKCSQIIVVADDTNIVFRHALIPPRGYSIAGVSGSCGAWVDGISLIITR